MSGKRRDYGTKIAEALAGAVATYVARKVIVFAWRKVTGSEPPDKDSDQQTPLGQAVTWAMLTGAGLGAARVLGTRFARRQVHRQMEPLP
jgi:uncharacterized protein DUF4235